MPGVREFMETSKGKVIAGAFLVAAIGAAVYAMKSGMSNGSELANGRMFIDAKTGKTFSHDLKVGEKIPLKSSVGDAGYPAELCFWTKDGKPKSTPTYVLLNESLGKPGPTFCPDCGRLVTANNPPADSTISRLPPTQAEYEARQAARGGSPAASPDAQRDR